MQPCKNKGLEMKKGANPPAAPDASLAARVTAALERLAPPPLPAGLPAKGAAFVWEPAMGALTPVPHVASIEIGRASCRERVCNDV